MLIYLNSLQLITRTRTQVSLSITLNICLRLVGGKKPSGHVHKILETLAKPKPMFTNTPQNPVTKQSSHVSNNKQSETFTKLKDNQTISFKEPTSIKKQVENSPIDAGMHTPMSIWASKNIESTNICQSTDFEDTFISTLPVIEIQENSSKEVSVFYEGEGLQKIKDISCNLVHELRKHGFLDDFKNSEGYVEEKLNKKFHHFYNKLEKDSKIVKINEEKFTAEYTNNNPFDVGLLQVSNVIDTAFLTGIHVHAGIFFTFMNNHKIIWSYLTSTKGTSSVQLSDTQPLNFDKQPQGKPKQQMICFLDKPLIITSNQVSPFSDCILTDGEVKKQQEILEEYVKKHHDVLKDHFKNKIIPRLEKENYNVERYNGTGITEKDILDVIALHKEASKDEVNKIFKNYMQKKKQKGAYEADIYLKKTKATLDDFTLNLVNEHIKDNEKL